MHLKLPKDFLPVQFSYMYDWLYWFFQGKLEKQIYPPKDSDIVAKPVEVPEKQAIPRPPPELDKDAVIAQVKPFGDTKSGQNKDALIELQNSVETKDKRESPRADDGDKKSDGVKNITIKVPTKKVNISITSVNATNQPVLKQVEKKVLKFGESFKNKTIGDWETVKNKTLEKLTNLGVIKKPEYIKLIYAPVKWSLNMSLEDIGNIMKDTQYFQVKQNLTEMEYHPLMSPNSTQKLNVTETKYGFGYCDCKDLECMCCVRIYNKWMRLNSTACSLITFSSKSQVCIELVDWLLLYLACLFQRKVVLL